MLHLCVPFSLSFCTLSASVSFPRLCIVSSSCHRGALFWAISSSVLTGQSELVRPAHNSSACIFPLISQLLDPLIKTQSYDTACLHSLFHYFRITHFPLSQCSYLTQIIFFSRISRFGLFSFHSFSFFSRCSRVPSRVSFTAPFYFLDDCFFFLFGLLKTAPRHRFSFSNPVYYDLRRKPR